MRAKADDAFDSLLVDDDDQHAAPASPLAAQPRPSQYDDTQNTAAVAPLAAQQRPVQGSPMHLAPPVVPGPSDARGSPHGSPRFESSRLQNQTINNRYQFVYRARDLRTNTDVALKALQKHSVNKEVRRRMRELAKRSRQTLRQEIAILHQVRDNENIVQILDVQSAGGLICIVTELCELGDLKSYMGRRRSDEPLGEPFARTVARQLGNALEVLYKRNLCHRDLKPHNILLQNGPEGLILKVADFGFARYIESFGTYTPCGTMQYMAPEVLAGERYDIRADLWSVGILLFEIIFGRRPWKGDRPVHRDARLRIPGFPMVSEDCVDLLQRLLKPAPADRMTYPQFLRHPFVRADGLLGFLSVLPYYLVP